MEIHVVSSFRMSTEVYIGRRENANDGLDLPVVLTVSSGPGVKCLFRGSIRDVVVCWCCC